MKNNRVFLLIASMLSFLFTLEMSAQKNDGYKYFNDANKLYEQKKYADAEVNYRRAITSGKNIKEGSYNLGNTYYQQGKFDEAAKQYEGVTSLKSLNREEMSKNFFNLGNALLKEKKYPESIQAYKNALKANPADNDTRYNLAYAQSMLQKQQQQQKKDNKNDKKDQKKDQQQQQQQQQQDKEDKQEQKQEQVKKDKISKEDAEKILQALNNDEKKTQKKINVKEASKVSIEKQW